MFADAAIIVGAYLFGSLPHLQMLAWLRGIRLQGDYHQDLWSRAGRITGVLGIVGEFVKGAVPVIVARALDFDIAVIALAGVATVSGQMWPVFTRFDGEKGNSIGLAMTIALVPYPALVAMIPVIVSLVFRTAPRLKARSESPDKTPVVGGEYSRSLPLGMVACFLVIPFSAWGFGEPPAVIWCLVALFVLIMLRRLTAGLGTDMKSGDNFWNIAARRLLYDRATVSWRDRKG
jgi:glycerol-3-phosphate acyltransferase PlsY